MSASAARMVALSPNTWWAHGMPRRNWASSIEGRSSNSSDAVWKYSMAMARFSDALLAHPERRRNAESEFRANHAAGVLKRMVQGSRKMGFGAMRQDESVREKRGAGGTSSRRGWRLNPFLL